MLSLSRLFTSKSERLCCFCGEIFLIVMLMRPSPIPLPCFIPLRLNGVFISFSLFYSHQLICHCSSGVCSLSSREICIVEVPPLIHILRRQKTFWCANFVFEERTRCLRNRHLCDVVVIKPQLRLRTKLRMYVVPINNIRKLSWTRSTGRRTVSRRSA